MSVNKLKKIKIKLRYHTQFAFWRMLNLIIISILLASSCFAIYFIHNNINMALENTALIINLKNSQTFDSLDLKNYDGVNKKIKEKDNLQPLSIGIRNIFDYDQDKTITTTTSSNQTSD